MRALQYLSAQQVAVADVPEHPPGPGEVQIRVAYVGLCGTDLHIVHGAMDARVSTPLVFGHEMSGTIERLGAGRAGLDGRRPRDGHAARLGRDVPRLSRRASAHLPEPGLHRHRLPRRAADAVERAGVDTGAPCPRASCLGRGGARRTDGRRGARRAPVRGVPRRPCRRARWRSDRSAHRHRRPARRCRRWSSPNSIRRRRRRSNELGSPRLRSRARPTRSPGSTSGRAARVPTWSSRSRARHRPSWRDRRGKGARDGRRGRDPPASAQVVRPASRCSGASCGSSALASTSARTSIKASELLAGGVVPTGCSSPRSCR